VEQWVDTPPKKEIIELLRQRSGRICFYLAPAIVGASIKVFELLEKIPHYEIN
jgi:glycine C-acetyltransferase